MEGQGSSAAARARGSRTGQPIVLGVLGVFMVALGFVLSAVWYQVLGVRDVEITLSGATCAVGAAAAILAELTSRLSGQRWVSWLGSAMALYSIVVVPATSMITVVPAGATGPLEGGRLTSYAGVVCLLVLAVRPPPVTRRLGWIIAGVAALATMVVVESSSVASARSGPLLPAPWVSLGVLVIWCGVSVAFVVQGSRGGQPSRSAVGCGLVLIGAAQFYRVTVLPDGGIPTETLFVGARLAGVLVVAGGLVYLARRSLSAVAIGRLEQQAELRRVQLHLRRAAEATRERDHELRNGLLAVSAVTALIGSRPEDGADPDDSWQRSVSAELARLQRLVEKPGSPCSPEGPTRVAPVLADVVAVRSFAGMDVRLAVEGDPSSSAPAQTVADVMSNLLGNAARHAPGSPVHVGVAQHGDRVKVEVRDEGPGILLGQEEAVFERGVRDPARGGDGLGLPVARRMVEEVGGSIGVESRGGGQASCGCAIVVELPAVGPRCDGRPGADDDVPAATVAFS